MQILKFKCQLVIAFFAAINHLNGPLRKQNFTLTGLKGHGLWFVFGGFRSVLCFCVSRFVACDRNYDWRQRKTQVWRKLLNFRVRMFVKRARRQLQLLSKLMVMKTLFLSVSVVAVPTLTRGWYTLLPLYLSRGCSTWCSLSSIHIGFFLGLPNIFLVPDSLVSKPVWYLSRLFCM